MNVFKKVLSLFLIFAVLLSCVISPLSLTTMAIADQANRNLARETVGEGIVMLKNNNNVLPLSSNNTVAFFGSGSVSAGFILGGGGSGEVYLDYTPPGPADVFSDLAENGKIGFYEPLYESYLSNSSYVPDEAMYNAAAEAADTAVVVITRKNGEGWDMTTDNWSLYTAEKNMLTTVSSKFENVVVILNCTSVMSTDWSLDGNSYGIDVDSLLVCCAPGEMGAYGIADIMLGDVNPSGKLADTFAMNISDYLSTSSYASDIDDVEYTEDTFVGYRYFETFNIPVAYEFGYGMSYTTFDITTDSVTNDGTNITVKATVKNTGAVAGKETVQVYYSAPQMGEGAAVLSKSVKDLAGFKKTDLLAPNQSQTVEITFDINDMASFDDRGYTGNKGCYVLEAGDYDILVGNSVKNVTNGGTYTVSELTVTEQTKGSDITQLESRLEADGSYVDPSYPILKDGRQFISNIKPTVIEAESTYEKYWGFATETVDSGKFYITDGYNWYSAGAGTSLGQFKNAVGQTACYKFYVQKAGKYNLGFIAGNAASSLADTNDLFYIDISTDGGSTWTQAENFAFDSPNTRQAQTITGQYWWNYKYTTADSDGNKYCIDLPEGELAIRFRVTSNASGENTNMDKFVLIPEGTDYTLGDVFEAYGIEGSKIIDTDSATWIEAEDYYHTNAWYTKKESYGTNGYLFNGKNYLSVDNGMVIGNMQSTPGAVLRYDITVLKEGTYTLGFTASNGNLNGYTDGKNLEDYLTVSISTDGGSTWKAVENLSMDIINTYAAKNETGSQYFNLIYTSSDLQGNMYNINLPEGNIKLQFTIDSDVDTNYCNANLDKFVLIPPDVEYSLRDVCNEYNIEYSDVINSTGATWYEGESFSATSGYVRSESYNAAQGYLHDGTVYVSLEAGACVGWFDKAAGGYAEYNLSSEKAGTYNMGFTISNGSSKIIESGKGYGVVDVYISSDGGTTWTKQFDVDVKSTNSVGTNAVYWNFYYSNSDFDNVPYTLNLPAGDFKLRLVSNNNSITYGGANIDKFVIYPQTIAYGEQDAVKYYFNGEDENSGTTEDDTTVDSSIDFDADNYQGITYADILAGTATWQELIGQMSYNELIDISYGKNCQWGFGYTGYIGFTDDANAEKYGIYAGDTADGGQGIRMTYYNTTYLPNATLQAYTWNPDLLEELGKMVADEMLRNNVDMWLAPGLNIHRNPLCGRNFEYYSEDPLVCGLIGAAIVNGVESKGVACVIKHFAANEKETNRKFSNSIVSEKALREIYLKSFEICIEASDPICVMSSYNMINGVYTSTNAWLLTTVLREEWGYTGLVMTDWTATPKITPEVNAGNNVKMLNGDPDEMRKSIAKGLITRETLEKNAYYIFTNLVKLPDNAINPYKVTDISFIGETVIPTTEYSRKAQNARLVKSGDYFNVPGKQNYFYEYKINVEKAGTYDLALEYASTSDVNSAFEIYVNGEKVTSSNNVTSTGALTATSSITACSIELASGVSTIQLRHISAYEVNYRSLCISGEEAETGDVNADGNVNILDIVRLKRIIAKASPQTAYADLNGDEDINALDITALKQIILK